MKVVLTHDFGFQEERYPANIIDPVFEDPVERTGQTPGEWGEICLHFQNDMVTLSYVMFLEFMLGRTVENVSFFNLLEEIFRLEAICHETESCRLHILPCFSASEQPPELCLLVSAFPA